jgi:hypothetical protein
MPTKTEMQAKSQFEIEQLCLRALRATPGLEHTEIVRIVELKGARLGSNWDVLVIHPRLPESPVLKGEAELTLGQLRQRYRLS